MGPYDNYPGLQPYYPPAPGGVPGYVPVTDPQVLAANFNGQLDALNRGQAESDRYWGEEAKRQAWNQAQVNAIEQPHDINPINVALAPLRILGGLIGGVRGALNGNVPYIGDTGFSPAQEISTVTGQQITQPQDSRGALGGILDFLTGESARKDAAYRALGQSILRNYGIQWKQDEANANELLKRAQQLHDLAGSYSELQNSQSQLGKANSGIYQDKAQAAQAYSAIPVNAAHAAFLRSETEGQDWKNLQGYKYDDLSALGALGKIAAETYASNALGNERTAAENERYTLLPHRVDVYDAQAQRERSAAGLSDTRAGLVQQQANRSAIMLPIEMQLANSKVGLTQQQIATLRQKADLLGSQKDLNAQQVEFLRQRGDLTDAQTELFRKRGLLLEDASARAWMALDGKLALSAQEQAVKEAQKRQLENNIARGSAEIDRLVADTDRINQATEKLARETGAMTGDPTVIDPLKRAMLEYKIAQTTGQNQKNAGQTPAQKLAESKFLLDTKDVPSDTANLAIQNYGLQNQAKAVQNWREWFTGRSHTVPVSDEDLFKNLPHETHDAFMQAVAKIKNPPPDIADRAIKWATTHIGE